MPKIEPMDMFSVVNDNFAFTNADGRHISLSRLIIRSLELPKIGELSVDLFIKKTMVNSFVYDTGVTISIPKYFLHCKRE